MIKKKVGNACRTKNQIRGSKSRGNQFEYRVEYNLKKIYGDSVKLLEKRGFAKEYDIEIGSIAIECKFHKSMSWNEMKKIWEKLKKVTSNHTKHLLIFKTNRQPVLIYNGVNCCEWYDYFSIQWEDKHD
jgi:hypothetical protein